MYYEINISKDGKHLFATAERSITSQAQLLKVYPILKEKFPVTEGYQVYVTYWEKIGHPLNEFEKIKKLINIDK